MRITIICVWSLFLGSSLGAQQLHQFKENGKVGYRTEVFGGNVVIPAIYEDGQTYPQERPYLFVKDARGWFFIDRKGKSVMNERYEKLMPYTTEHPIHMVKNGKYGLLDSNFSVLVEAQYVYIGLYMPQAKYAKAIRGTCNSIIGGKGCEEAWLDLNGKILTNTWYENITDFYEGRSTIKENGKFGAINEAGERVIPVSYNAMDWRFFEGLIWAEKGDCFTLEGCAAGFIDKNGTTVIPFELEKAKNFSKGMAPARKHLKWGFIDRAGNMVINDIYDNAMPFGEIGAVVIMGGKYGAVDATGKVIIPIKYEYLKESKGKNDFYWSAKEAGKYVNLNRKGEAFDPWK